MGPKWVNHFIDAGSESFDVVILGPEGGIVGTGNVIGVTYCQLYQTWEAERIYNPDPRQHTLAGLLAALRETYATTKRPETRVDPASINPGSYVSVVFYLVD